MATDVNLESFDHVGMVVKDAEATAKSWSALFGVGPWRFTPAGNLKLAHVKMGSIQVELLEPLDDKSLWAAFLAEHGEGLHHVCTRVADVDAAAAALEAEGAEIMISIPKAMAYVRTGGPGSIIMELLESEEPG